MAPIEVRPASSSDRAAILALDEAVNGTSRRESLLSEAVDGGRVLVAVVEGRVAGFAVHDTSFFDQMFIKLILVEPSLRRRGVASALIAGIERMTPGPKLFTSTNQSNAAMQRVLKSLGFVRSGAIDNLDEGDPELVYFKAIDAQER